MPAMVKEHPVFYSWDTQQGMHFQKSPGSCFARVGLQCPLSPLRTQATMATKKAIYRTNVVPSRLKGHSRAGLVPATPPNTSGYHEPEARRQQPYIWTNHCFSGGGTPGLSVLCGERSVYVLNCQPATTVLRSRRSLCPPILAGLYRQRGHEG